VWKKRRPDSSKLHWDAWRVCSALCRYNSTRVVLVPGCAVDEEAFFSEALPGGAAELLATLAVSA